MRLKALSLTLFGSLDGNCRPRQVLSTNCNAVPVDLAVDKEHTPALESLKLAVEGGRTAAGVEARPVVRQKTTEEVIHRLLGCQPEPEDLPALAVNDHIHEWTE